MESPPTSLVQFFKFVLKPHRVYIVTLMGTGVVWGLQMSLGPYFLKQMIDTINRTSLPMESILEAVRYPAFLYVGVWVTMAVNFRFVDWIHLKFFPSLKRDIIVYMYSYLNQHSYRYFQDHFAGNLSSKLSDIPSGTVSLLKHFEEAFSQIVALFIASVTMYMVHPIFAAMLLGWAVLVIIISVVLSKNVHGRSMLFAESKAKLMGGIVDSITNVLNIQLFARSRFENQHSSRMAKETVKKDRSMQWAILRMRLIQDLTFILMVGAMVYMLIHLYEKGGVSAGDFALILTLTLGLAQAIWYLVNQFVEIAEELGKCSQAFTMISMPCEIQDKKGAKQLKISKGEIRFERVNFYYNEHNVVFNQMDLTIQAGQKVGLVGFSGGGKTTLVNLILRFFDVESGRILIDNQSITEVTLESLRSHISMIPQDITLFHRTLMENIRYGNLAASERAVIEASKKAYCHDFIERLPEGYYTYVGERGVKLSGGQRQRIAIARAILKNAPILLLDEATSALDSVTEQHIQESLEELMEGRTTIVVAHRLSTLAKMDRILVFEQGRIIEDGSHRKLLRTKGHYAKLWSMQSDGFLPGEVESEESDF